MAGAMRATLAADGTRRFENVAFSSCHRGPIVLLAAAHAHHEDWSHGRFN